MSNIDNYQQEVISYKTAGSTNAEILAWLENNGVSTSTHIGAQAEGMGMQP